MVSDNELENSSTLNRLEHIQGVTADALPGEAVRFFVDYINQEIQNYHEADDPELKIDCLKKIKTEIAAFNEAFPTASYASSQGYLDLQAKLLDAIQAEMQRLGITSLQENPQAPDSITEIIANMSQEKADKLLGIMQFGEFFDIDELKQLYDESDKRPEAEHFRDFLQNHQVLFLGGSNSKNYEIVSLADQNRLVLKIELNTNPKYIRSKAALTGHLSTLHVERMANSNLYGRNDIRAIQIDNFYSEGSLREHSYSHSSPEARLDDSVNVGEEMASVFFDLSKAGIFFPDAKLENWLLSQDHRLLIADTKSLLPTVEEDGNMIYRLDESLAVYFTDNFITPEFNHSNYKEPVAIDPVHAYLLGKNLYYYLSGSRVPEDDGSRFDYTAYVFQGEKGQKLQSLIQALVKPEASERLSIIEASHQLFLINHPRFEEVFKDLKAFQFGSKDKEIDNYLQDMQNRIRKEPDKEADILREMQGMQNALQGNASINKIQSNIDHFRKKSGLFTMGMEKKADRIEQAMSQVPLADRLDLENKRDTPAVKNLLQALASHRHLHQRAGNVEKNTERRPAKSFQEFKSRYLTKVSDGKSEEKPENPAPDSRNRFKK